MYLNRVERWIFVGGRHVRYRGSTSSCNVNEDTIIPLRYMQACPHTMRDARSCLPIRHNERIADGASSDTVETHSGAAVRSWPATSVFQYRPPHNIARRAGVPAIGLRTLGISEIGEGGCSYCAGGGGGG